MIDPTLNNLEISLVSTENIEEELGFAHPADPNAKYVERDTNELSGPDATGCIEESLVTDDRLWKQIKRRRPMPPTSGISSEGEPDKEKLPYGLRKGRKKDTSFRKQQDAEEEIENQVLRLEANRAVRRQNMGNKCDMETAIGLKNQVLDDVGMILNVSAKSRNLKGTFQRALKDAAASIKAAVEVLYARSVTEETAKLQAENARLQVELAEIRKEVADLRGTVAKASESLTPQPPPQVEKTKERTSVRTSMINNETEELIRSVMIQVGGMLNARLEALEGRLLPEKRIRPPLAADRTASKEAMSQSPSQKTTVKENVPKAIGGKGKKTKKGTTVIPESNPNRMGAPQLPQMNEAVETMETDWTTVVKRGTKAKAVAPHKALQGKPVNENVKPKSKTVPAKLRPPKSSAVVISLQPSAAEQGVSYANVLAKAREAIDLSSCGITGLKFKTAATGARILEIPGATSGEKADCLAKKLREVLGEGIAKVSRPIKRTELRISGLDDSVAPAEVVAAVAQSGGCPTEAVQVGEIKKSFRGDGSIWVRCPVLAAKNIGEGGNIRIGWVSAKVELLPQREMRCYRCLQPGHVRARCTEEEDRSTDCYRCGKPGHKARECSAEPKCSLCAAANRPAGHRLGSKECLPPKNKKNTKAVSKDKASDAPTALPLVETRAAEAMTIS